MKHRGFFLFCHRHIDNRITFCHWPLWATSHNQSSNFVLDKHPYHSEASFFVAQVVAHSARAMWHMELPGFAFARALCLLVGHRVFIWPFPHFRRGIEQTPTPEMLASLVVNGKFSKLRPVAFLSIVCHNQWHRRGVPNTACSRLALRAEFQSYFRVVITFRGAKVIRRIRQAADANVRWPLCWLSVRKTEWVIGMQNENKSRLNKRILILVMGLGIILAIIAILPCVGITFLTATNGRFGVEGDSMSPALKQGDLVFVQENAYKLHPPERGDIILLHRDTRIYLKRVIGLPGEVVEIHQGQVFINEQPLSEPYRTEPPVYSMEPHTIATEHYFVLGDNRNTSSDSHNWGTVPFSAIDGKVWFIYWPLSRIGTIQSYDYTHLNP